MRPRRSDPNGSIRRRDRARSEGRMEGGGIGGGREWEERGRKGGQGREDLFAGRAGLL